MDAEKKKTDGLPDPMDFYDFGPEPKDDPEYDAAVLPDHVKALIAKRAAKHKEPAE